MERNMDNATTVETEHKEEGGSRQTIMSVEQVENALFDMSDERYLRMQRVAACRMSPAPDHKRLEMAAMRIKAFLSSLKALTSASDLAPTRSTDATPKTLHGMLGELPTDLQLGIFKALYKRALIGKELVSVLQKESFASIKFAMAPLMERGIIANRRGRGYYRPDAPPEE